jgi:DNA modification methylase
VLDPFLGSGTSAAVSRDLGRPFYGFDHSPRYVQVARARVLGLSL